MVRRIFAEYLAGRGLFAIAEGLTRDAVCSPSQHDAVRNPHRTGQGWAKSAVRAILRNPRYTGRQVWNKQRKDEILLDVNDVARGYETRMRRNDTRQWVWSETLAHEPLVSIGDFDAAQATMAGAGRARHASHETRQRVCNPYVLRGRVYCGFCHRRMQGQYNHGAAYYRCRYPREYALASHIYHPGNVYLREADVLPAIDKWLSAIFAPHRLAQTIREMQAAQPPVGTGPAEPGEDTRAVIADCDVRLARYQATLDAGADPQAVAEWTRQVKAERAGALARDARDQAHSKAGRQLTEDDIGHPHHRPRQPARRHPRRRARREGSHLRPARPQRHLQARRSENPGRSHHRPGEICRARASTWGYGSCPRGDLNPHAPFRALAPQASASAYSATRTYARPRYRPGSAASR